MEEEFYLKYQRNYNETRLTGLKEVNSGGGGAGSEGERAAIFIRNQPLLLSVLQMTVWP